MPLSPNKITPTNPNIATDQITSREIVELLEDRHGNVLYEATYTVKPDKSLELIRKTWHDETLRALNEDPAPATATRDAGSTAIEAGKLVWEIIKDNRAVAITSDSMTSVLSQADTDSMHYANSKHGESDSYTFIVRDSLITSIKYVYIVVSASGYLHGMPVSTSPAPKGFYLPSVYFNVSRCDVDWPVTAKGFANLENPVNVGSENEAVAEVRMHAKLTAEWVFQSINISIGFKANGKTGFWYLGMD